MMSSLVLTNYLYLHIRPVQRLIWTIGVWIFEFAIGSSLELTIESTIELQSDSRSNQQSMRRTKPTIV